MTATEAPGGDVRHIFKALQRFDAGRGRRLIIISVLSFGNGLAEAAILALITSAAVSSTGTTSQSFSFLHLSTTGRLWLAAGLLVVNGIMGYLLSSLSANVSSTSALAARQQLLNAFQRTSYQQKSGRRVASLQEALTTYVDRFTYAFTSLIGLLGASLALVSFGVMAIVINYQAALALVLVGSVVVVVQQPASRLTRKASKILGRQRDLYAQGATEAVLLARELAVFGVAESASEVLRELDRSVAYQYRRARFLGAFTPKVYQLTAFGLTIGGLAMVAGSEVKNLAAIASVALIILRSLSYGQALLTNMQQLAEHRPYVDKLIALIEEYQAEPRHLGTERVGQLKTIDFRDVGFSYDGSDAMVLHGVDLTIGPGETIGIVGPSGAGKTTLANLLLRLYEPTAGTILINEIPIGEIQDEEWHQRIAVVPQEPRLVHGTVRDNITFLREIDQEGVAQAAREANIAAFIEAQPKGYDAPVGELGQGLSGGQRQRICIARALAGQPDLLVLDEPTSALDGESEAAVQRTLEDLKGRVTMVIVAHRLSTLAICDRIVVVNDGTIAAAGTPDELRASSAYYREALTHAGL